MNVREVLYLILFSLLVGLGILGIKHVKDWYDLKERAASSIAIGTTTSDLLKDGGKADHDRDSVDQGLKTGREEFRNQYEGAKRDDPETADRAARPVPTRVRQSFRERRLARERLGCSSRKCEEGSPDNSASQR